MSSAIRRVGHGAAMAPWLTIFSGAITTCIYIAYGPAPKAFVWDQNLYMHEPWRLFSAHFVHCDNAHIWWNLPPFLLQGWLLERYGARAWFLGVGAGMAGVDIFLALWPGAPMIYCGLSGLLNAMLVMIVFHIWQKNGYYPVFAIAAVDMLKISAEINNGGALISSASWPSAPTAHGFGFATAAALCLALYALRGPMIIPRRPWESATR